MNRKNKFHSSNDSHNTAKDQPELVKSKNHYFERSNKFIFLTVNIVWKKSNKSYDEERQDVYQLVGIICDNLFQKEDNDQSIIFYFDGDDWIHNEEK